MEFAKYTPQKRKLCETLYEEKMGHREQILVQGDKEGRCKAKKPIVNFREELERLENFTELNKGSTSN
jgi:hypothetical protein